VTTEIIIQQRIRNRQIEMLEWFVSYELETMRLTLTSLLNSWEDFVGAEHPLKFEDFPFPTYTDDEYRALCEVDNAWQKFCDATPSRIFDDVACFRLSQWKDLVLKAKIALTIFMRRGRMRED
jgi:hypothetical protein